MNLTAPLGRLLRAWMKCVYFNSYGSHIYTLLGIPIFQVEKRFGEFSPAALLPHANVSTHLRKEPHI